MLVSLMTELTESLAFRGELERLGCGCVDVGAAVAGAVAVAARY